MAASKKGKAGVSSPKRSPEHGLTFIVPAYNEENAISSTLARLHKALMEQDLPFEIIVVNDGSTDQTRQRAEVCDGARVIDHPINTGYGSAIKSGVRVAKYDWVGIVDADGTYEIEKVGMLIDKMKNGFDMVIASRYLDGAKSEDDSLITAFGNWLFTATVNVLYGGSYTDCMVIYRAWRSSLYKELDIHLDETFEFYEKLYRTKLGIEPLLSVRALKRNLKVGEIPGDEPPRIGGHRKLQIIKWGLSFYTSFFRELWFWK